MNSVRPLPILAVAIGLLPLFAAAPANESFLTRFGYFRDLSRNINDNDLHNALRAYGAAIAHNSEIPTNPDNQIFDTYAQLETALRQASVDMISAPATAVLKLPPELLEPPFIISGNPSQKGVQYILLTRSDSGLASPADLAGRRLNLIDDVHSGLALPWLEILFDQAHLDPPASTLQALRSCPKASLAALPVFFHQVDACVISRASFDTLCELNPQLGRQLRVIASSPRLFPLITAFRRGLDPARRDAVTDAMLHLSDTPAGQQVLLLFQVDSLAFCDDADLASTRELIAAHARLSAPHPDVP